MRINEFLYSPVFGSLLTIILYIIGDLIAKRINKPYVNKLMIGIILGVAFLSVTKIPYEAYEIGVDYILFFLPPVVVILAVPLYRNYKIIYRNKLIFFAGCLFAFVINFVSIFFIMKFFDLSEQLKIPMYTKSISGPMAMELNIMLGTDESIAVLMVALAGITCGFLGGLLIKVFKPKSPLSVGIGLGGICHITGTYLSMELEGEQANAVASTTMIVNGVITVIVLPILLNLIGAIG